MISNNNKDTNVLIKSITLCGNKRLLPADIKYFHAKFKNTHQLILGLNGSGKSTTIQELNPMPATPADYLNGGYKKIEIEHQGNLYTLVSTIGTSNHHSFVMNDIELNDGGTSSVQKVLVLEHFNLDEKLIEVLTDQTRFHLFSPNERRNWLTRLSGTNMDFAISFFKHLKTLHRDAEAVVKHMDARLAKESSDITTPEQLDDLENAHKKLEHSVLSLLEYKDKDVGEVSHLRGLLDGLSMECSRLAEDIVRTKVVKPINGVYGRSELITLREKLNEDMQSYKGQEQLLLKEYTELKDALNAAAEVENRDIGELQLLKTQTENTIASHARNITRYSDIQGAVSIHGATDAIWQTLNGMVIELYDNSESTFTREAMSEAEVKLEDIKDKVRQAGIKLDLAKTARTRLIGTEEVECPSCETTFKPGVDAAMLENLENKILKYESLLDTLKEEREVIDKYLSEGMSYIAQYKRLINLMNNTPSLKPLWDDLKSVDLTKNSPHVLLPIMNAWYKDVELHLAIAKLEPELVYIDATIDKVRAVENTEISHTQKRVSDISEKISEVNSKYFEALEVYDLTTLHLDNRDAISDMYTKLLDITRRRNEIKIQLLDSMTQQHLSYLLSDMNAKLSEYTTDLNRAKSAREILADLTFQKQKAEHERDVLKTLLKELNPTDGLIAKQSKMFIEQFVEQLNSVIQAVWSYEMKVLPCPIESEKLTYKFPLYFPATDASTQDVSKSSAAQKGIVDFAFKLVVMAYLGLEDYPLYLDELAPSLDEKHRINIMAYVKNFVESKQCSQMFMISHYLESHGVFQNTNNIVMDKTNLLSLPNEYNTDVEISSKMRTLVH